MNRSPHRWIRTCCALLLSCLLVATPWAAELSAKRQAVLMSMFKPDAVLTEQVHRDFWAGLDVSDVAATEAAQDRLAAAMRNSLEFESATALSYKASMKQRKPVVNPRYESALKDRLVMLKARNLSPDSVLAKDKAFRASLVPISRGKPFEVDGKSVVMTPALADAALKQVEASHDRLERLLDPVWREAAK
ncbi:hypothetical protein [Paracidovorax valerianellae]|uniref:Uncharacterized protein n=1 Tax=Paracidovorax valerianellae TaxID=187868 RepID=A0A1G6S7X3_9BURK|nr:hypothetical protein [Paracidovorax valerianellae]MDA8444199.1 hypothetical protein [Paracidovorax valerianellae]SDD12227.1 hypothetical protein SAMN05192589_104351 [Paracidovorax valerianellae]